ncbi:tRNA pseudouridine(55) synthase TruB [Sodalis sp. CWE]|uniref:tRNA pseudouridine(55) synthase TruB n=1 Tax=Sodalis sp. CWE TaxID=2803816 RepID=UPI00351D664A
MSRSSYHNRDIDGIILVDKPTGLSSNELLQKVKRLFRANKAGHTGSLDPIATGMFPICFGEATKFSQFLLNADKYYQVTARFGKRTDTADSEGRVIAVRQAAFSKLELENALNQFRGKITQIPSMFSAIKYRGQPLYKYARHSVTVNRKARSIQIYNIQLHYWDLKQVELEIHCSKGTYIRTIIDDLGEHLGCGAHVVALRRLRVANYLSKDMISLGFLQTLVKIEKLKPLKQLDSLLLKLDSAVMNIPEVNLPPNTANKIRFGQTIEVSKKLKIGLVRLTEGYERRFFGIGEIFALGYLSPRRLIKTTNK